MFIGEEILSSPSLFFILVMHFFSPAKLNIFLQLLGKRDDGFHEIVTRYQAVAFGDQLSLSVSSCDSLHVVNSPQLETPNNSVWKSTELFRQYTGITDPVTWRIVKHIPIGSGLAGGSSNAATALFALNKLFQTGLSEEEMRSLAKYVGMDTPFFFSSGSALGFGRGEEIVSLEDNVLDKYVLYLSEGLQSEIQELAALVQEMTSLEVILWDERLSSAQAERMLKNDCGLSRKQRKHSSDSLAATLILSSFLDFRKFY